MSAEREHFSIDVSCARPATNCALPEVECRNMASDLGQTIASVARCMAVVQIQSCFDFLFAHLTDWLIWFLLSPMTNVVMLNVGRNLTNVKLGTVMRYGTPGVAEM